MKKYYRNRYHSFLKAIIEQNKKRDQDLEELKQKEERRKAKLKENLGIVNVQSRFMEDPSTKQKEAIIEEIPQKQQVLQKTVKRGSSLAPLKSATSSSNFNRTTKDDESISQESQLSQIYNVKLGSAASKERSRSKNEKRAKTPKVK